MTRQKERIRGTSSSATKTALTTNDEVYKKIDEIRARGQLVIEKESRKQSKLPTQGGILLFFPFIQAAESQLYYNYRKNEITEDRER